MSKPTVFDAARYILEKKGRISSMKLQKLAYYTQAWSLAWDEAPLFDNKIEAWANGPVVRDLYDKHKGRYFVTPEIIENGKSDNLNSSQKETIDAVLDAYGDKSAQWLSDQTHSESPWIAARSGLSESERGDKEIPLESIAEYYSSVK